MMEAPAAFTEPVNLGNPHEMTIRELAKTIIDMTGSRSRVVPHLSPQDDPKQRKPDISLAEEKLAWVPTVPLRDGLAKTIAYFERLVTTSTSARPSKSSGGRRL